MTTCSKAWSGMGSGSVGSLCVFDVNTLWKYWFKIWDLVWGSMWSIPVWVIMVGLVLDLDLSFRRVQNLLGLFPILLVILAMNSLYFLVTRFFSWFLSRLKWSLSWDLFDFLDLLRAHLLRWLACITSASIQAGLLSRQFLYCQSGNHNGLGLTVLLILLQNLLFCSWTLSLD